MLYLYFSGQNIFPSKKYFFRLIIIGIFCQLVANTGSQWAMGILGLTVVVPLTVGAILITSASISNIFLKEPLTKESLYAIGLLIFAIILISHSASDAHNSIVASGAKHVDIIWVILAVLMTVLSGMIYSVLSGIIRHTVSNGTSIIFIIFIITFLGILIQGPLSYYRLGGNIDLLHIKNLNIIILAGILNFIGFIALVSGLKLTKLINANIINATQVTLAALAGFFLFQESLIFNLILGTILTIFGVLLASKAQKKENI